MSTAAKSDEDREVTGVGVWWGRGGACLALADLESVCLLKVQTVDTTKASPWFQLCLQLTVKLGNREVTDELNEKKMIGGEEGTEPKQSGMGGAATGRTHGVG